MAKGPIITAEVKQLIAKVYLQHPGWRAKEIRNEVSKWLLNENPKLPPDWPGLSIIQKELVKIRKSYEKMTAESQGLDRPWGTGNLAEYPIPPEALPSVLQVWVYVRENMKKPFTIREAQWTGRLYATTKDIATLAKFALWHALNERIMSISGSTSGPSSQKNMQIFSHMTGQIITHERLKRIFSASSECPPWKMIQYYDPADRIEAMFDEGYTFEEVQQKIKEAHDERPHK